MQVSSEYVTGALSILTAAVTGGVFVEIVRRRFGLKEKQIDGNTQLRSEWRDRAHQSDVALEALRRDYMLLFREHAEQAAKIIVQEAKINELADEILNLRDRYEALEIEFEIKKRETAERTALQMPHGGWKTPQKP